MSRNSGKSSRSFPTKKQVNSKPRGNRNLQEEQQLAEQEPTSTLKEVQPLNFAQSEYLRAIKSNEIIFGIGSAGTGKTFVAAAYAAEELFYRRVGKIYLTRPNIEVGRGLGFLPGTLEEKYEPYLLPFASIFNKTLGKGLYEYCLKNKDIEPVPLGFLRGTTFENCIVLLDEAQNCTKEELKMLLSRIGKNCKIILSGDTEQSDIVDSGLADAAHRLRNIPGVEVIKFLDSDIVRSRLCKAIIMAYRN
jgi:phosphate starvation-inducible PhoH-like protein